MKGKVLQGFFSPWNRCHRSQLLFPGWLQLSCALLQGHFQRGPRVAGYLSLLHSHGSLHALMSSSVVSVEPGSRSVSPGLSEVFPGTGSTCALLIPTRRKA